MSRSILSAPRRLAMAVWSVVAASSAWADSGLEVTVFRQGSLAPVAGAEVRVENPSIAYTARERTDALGQARFGPLSTAGAYMVAVAEGPDHYAARAEGLVLRSNFQHAVTLSLVPRASASETISVTAETGAAHLNAVNAEVSSTLERREIETIAVEGREVTRALYRLPGVVQATGFYPEAPNVSINGANALYANYMVDGLDNNENFLGGQKFATPTGFTQQVTVLTSNYSTEFGRTGNGIFNLTSRSGGNDVRGEVFYLTRPGPALDAQSPFTQRDLSGNAVKDGFARHQGGFAVGGPLREDRTFFFVDAEYTRDRKDNLLRARTSACRTPSAATTISSTSRPRSTSVGANVSTRRSASTWAGCRSRGRAEVSKGASRFRRPAISRTATVSWPRPRRSTRVRASSRRRPSSTRASAGTTAGR